MNKNLNFKCNIDVKAMTSGVNQKSSALNLLVSVNGDIQYTSIINIIKIFFTIQKDFS